VLTITQRFDSIECTLHTQESSSYSVNALISKDEYGNDVLSYNYLNEPRIGVRHRSQIHNGFVTLKILDNNLEGSYWTDRRTTGGVELVLKDKGIAKSFKEAKNL